MAFTAIAGVSVMKDFRGAKRRMFNVRLTRYSFALASLMFASVPFASAQSAFDLNMGFGTARVGANGGGLDNLNSVNALGACSLSAGDPFCQATPGLSGFFLGLGGDVMFKKHFGVGAEFNVQPAKSGYGPLQYRQSFYDVNGIFAPVSRKRVELQLLGGIGGAKTSFALTQSACVGTAVCSTQTQPVGNSTHFQVHAGVGIQLLITDHIFVRPQFDYRYVPNLNQQFGSNNVPQGSVWVGYRFGDRS